MIVETTAQREAYENFVKRHHNGHLFQSQIWSEVKRQWTSEYCLSYNAAGEINGALCVRVRRIEGIPFSLLYASRAPVCDYHDAQALASLVEDMHVLAKRHRAICVKMDTAAAADDARYAALLRDLGCRFGKRHAGFEGIQARFLWRIGLAGKTEEEVFSGFSAKHRYNTRLARKRGVVVRRGTKEDIPAFHALMRQTGRRDYFRIRPLSYFHRLLEALGEAHGVLLLAYEGDRPVAGLIGSLYAGMGLYLYGASGDAGRQAMPAYLLQWEMMRLLLARGAHTYDMRGVPGTDDEKNPLYGLYRFKKGFGGARFETIGEMQWVFHPVLHRVMNGYFALRKACHALRFPARGGRSGGAPAHEALPAAADVPAPDAPRRRAASL